MDVHPSKNAIFIGIDPYPNINKDQQNPMASNASFGCV